MTTTDLNNIPDEVLFYSNDQFYTFIEECLGVDEMNLLKLQSIRNIRTLINVPNVFSVLSIKCKELVDIKKRICFIDEDDAKNIVVKLGIKTGVDNLIEALKKKNDKYYKKTKSRRTSISSSSFATTNHSKSDTSSTDRSNLDSTDASSMNTSSLDSVDSSSTATPTPATAHNVMPSNTLIQVISDSIEKFSSNTFKNFYLNNNHDYVIHLTSSNRDINAYITCGCKSKIKIAFRSNTNTFQLSAYFKHLKNSRCSMIKKKKERLTKISHKTNISSNDTYQNGDMCNSDNDTNVEDLNDENDSSEITNNSTISSESFPVTRKRPISSVDNTKKKKTS